MKFLIATLFAFCMIPVLAEASTDSSIMEVIRVTNFNEMELAKLAKEKSENRKVDMFAQDLLRNHSISSDNLKVWAKGKSIAFKSTTDSELLSRKTEALHGRLLGLKGRDFDRAYIDSVVEDHQAMLENLNKELIPNAHDAELEQILLKTKESVALHLDEAKKIQTSLRE